MTQKGITLKEVAAAANVSRATAARALNSYGYVGDETALRAVEAADRLGYRAKRVAQALRSGQLPLVGLTAPYRRKTLGRVNAAGVYDCDSLPMLGRVGKKFATRIRQGMDDILRDPN
ncbi:LacI family DNA-binding transcriptional regulator [Mesorhizobium sp. M0306]|uniref:LacI family DNA-binding transcriptional regulator n=1 Tax=unclassified Mesorhizobium TaxID=325217 RepID=UPI00333590F5